MSPVEIESLFWQLFEAKNEEDVDQVIASNQANITNVNWAPLGGIESNFGVVENQQSNPVAAVVEKITNSIDAILMRKCYEAGIEPRSENAPRSVEGAITQFFPNSSNWDLPGKRNNQAESIQIIADSNPGDTKNTSLIIYDDGEGQHPGDFEGTFLSLLRGNKNEIHFVQGKYNMGGSGAIVFCGKKRYQLIGSKRYDGTGLFGFTLIRKHPLSSSEITTKKNTWYEYLKIGGTIPAFPIESIDLGLYNRQFRTGTVLKLYSYDLKGNIPINRELARSLNEFLFEPALPFYTVETKPRYPNDRNLVRGWMGLRAQLTSQKNEYIQETFTERYNDRRIGEMKVTVYVFKTKISGKTAAETKKTIEQEYFKNNMSVLFSVNGQVHGHYTSEFVTRALKFNLLRDYLLIFVDCTGMNIDFRNELFMASRDRLKQGEESAYLRRTLANNLGSGRLKDVYKERKDTISVESADEDSILKEFAENLPMNTELRRLISSTFKLDQEQKSPKKQTKSEGTPKQKTTSFNPKRFPSFFRLDTRSENGQTVLGVPLNGTRAITFDSDVENEYFDRTDEPGDLQIALMTYIPNNASGGTQKGTVNTISDVLNVTRRSPQEGEIKVVVKPTEEVQVGDKIEIRVDLKSPAEVGNEFQEGFWVKITAPLPPKPQEVPLTDEEPIGLPRYILVYRDAPDDNPNVKTWANLDNLAFDFDIVMRPVLEGDTLDAIYINMDSNVLRNYKSRLGAITEEQNKLANRRYISSIYFHTLFLYVINKKKNFAVYQSDSSDNFEQPTQSVDLDKYLSEVFSSYYAAFLLNFGANELMTSLA